VAGKVLIHHMDNAIKGLQRAPGLSAVFPAKKPLQPARFQPFVDPGKRTEEFAASLYGGLVPGEGAQRRLEIERFMRQYKPTTLDS